VPRHILKAADFDKSLLEALFERAEWIRETFHNDSGGRDHLRRLHPRKMLLYVFEEPSTRTRISFCSAALHLGMTVEGTDNIEFSSRKKGESWEDMGRVISGYNADVVVARTTQAGAVDLIAVDSLCSVINGGDGDREHPTQMLVDLYTIWREFKTLDRLHIAVCGDLLRGRTVHSLVSKMSEFPGTCFTFFSPKELMLKPELRQMLKDKHISFTEHHQIAPDLLKGVAVFYQTRSQDERDGGYVADALVVGRQELGWLEEEAILLHPLPVGPGKEISDEVRAHARKPLSLRDRFYHAARFFEQSDNGLWIRMPVLEFCMDALSV